MNDAEYTALQQQLLCFARIVKDLDLDGFLERIHTCETIAPMLDPTLYMKGVDNLEMVKELAVGLRNFQKVVKKLATNDRHTKKTL